MKIETKAVHAGRHVDRATGAVTPPIHLSSTFEREPDGSYPTGFEYSVVWKTRVQHFLYRWMIMAE